MSSLDAYGSALLPIDLSWDEYIQILAEANGIDEKLTDRELSYLLWECTAWPVAGFLYVRGQLIAQFKRMKEEYKVSEEALKVLDPVDDVPEDPMRARESKWDPIIAQAKALAASEPGKWLPVERPKNFAGAQVKWLLGRTPELLAELRPKYLYLRWDPTEAEVRRERDERERQERKAAKGAAAQ